MSGDPTSTASRDAALAVAILAVDPAGLGGAVLRARFGPVREGWLSRLRALVPAQGPWRTLPLHAPESRVLGGLDLAATLAGGRPVEEPGLLAQAHGGVLVVAMAERVAAGTAAHLAGALDTGTVRVERDGFTLVHPARLALIALDEGDGPEERTSEVLRDRLALHLDLDATPPAASTPTAAEIACARRLLPTVADAPEACAALCAAAAALGIPSLRPPILALRVARISAALHGRTEVLEADATLAARLVLAPRARAVPAESAEAAPEQPEQPDAAAGKSKGEPETLDDVVLAAAAAAVPADILASLRAGSAARRSRAPGGAGAERRAALRGRPAGVRPGLPRRGARLALLDTLRAAAPWQRLRGGGEGRVRVRSEDLRITRFKERARATTIFVVDASGSAALHRLAEAKGAVELVLAQCYVRRDRVALIAFRGAGAEVLLAPTASLVRAKRDLARLPGGGGTPLASGLHAAGDLARDLVAKGETALVVLLTDGRANVARDGAPGRPRAEAEAAAAARTFAGAGIPGLVVDIAAQPGPRTRELAALMGARHLVLPRADAAGLARAVGAAGAS